MNIHILKETFNMINDHSFLNTVLNESYNITLSKDDIVNIIIGSLNVLEKKNVKVVKYFYESVISDNLFTIEKLLQFLSGIYQALIDYAKKNTSTVNKTLKKNKDFVAESGINESLRDYKNSDKTIIWKIGYAIIQYEIANKSTRRLRLYIKLFMTSKSARLDNGVWKEQWDFNDDEKAFLKLFAYKVNYDVETRHILNNSTQNTYNSININHNNTNNNTNNNISNNQDIPDNSSNNIDNSDSSDNLNIQNNSLDNIPESLILNFDYPRNPTEFIWPFPLNHNIRSLSRLKKVFEKQGYNDDDLEMSHHIVFTNDEINKFAVGLQISKKNLPYLYLIKKNNKHYWEPLLIDTEDGEKTLLEKYDYNTSFNDNILTLLYFMPEEFFPLKLK